MIFGARIKKKQSNAKLDASSQGNALKFYDDAITTRKILFFTRVGCRPCLQLKPTCEFLARQNGFVFEEVYADDEKNRGLVIQYKIAPTPEVVLIDGNITKQWGAADLFDDKLALYLSNLPIPVEPDPFDDGKPIVPPAQASSNGNLLIPLAAFAWWHFKRKKRIGNTDDNQTWLIGGGLLLLLWGLSKGSGNGLNGDWDWMMELSMENEGEWEPENAHTRKDLGNFHKGKAPFLGTSWGITADFLEHWYGITVFKADSIKIISKDEAKKIFSETVMAYARVKEVKDKYVAALYFDWMMQRPSTCLEYVMTKMYKLSQTDLTAAKKGFYSKKGVTDNVIALLNADNAKDTFEKLKGWRLWHLENTSVYASFREGVRERINRYQYP